MRFTKMDMAFSVGVFDGIRVLFDCYVDCSVDGSLVLDVEGSVKLEQLENAGVIAMQFDEVLRILSALLRNRFVVLYDHENVFDVLRIELHRDQYFDVGFNRLIRNEALRGGGSCWLRALSACAPLADLWNPVFNADMPEFGLGLGRGLLKLYARVKKNTPPRAPLPAPDFVTTRRYRSTVCCASLRSLYPNGDERGPVAKRPRSALGPPRSAAVSFKAQAVVPLRSGGRRRP